MCLRDPRKAFEAKLLELGKDNEAIVAIYCDSASGGGLGAFFQAYPNRSVEVGISEQTAVGISAAMARQGFIPVVVAIDPFLTMRAYEQIRDDVGYMHTNVKLVASGGGLAYSTLGSTHMALEDVALMRTVPNLVVLCPGDADEVEFCLEEAIKIDGPVFIRMPRQAKEPPAKRTQRKMELGRGEVLVDGGVAAALFTYGPSTAEAVEAAEILQEQGVSMSVINFTTLKPLDEELIRHYASSAKKVFVLEEHAPNGGLGSAVADVLARSGISVPLKVFCVPEGAKQTGPYEALLNYYGISGSAVARRVMSVLSGD